MDHTPHLPSEALRQDDQQVLHHAIQALQDYALDHLSFEEDYMQRLHYPELARHVHSHEQLKQELTNKLADSKASTDERGELLRLAHFLANWFSHHIMVEDRKIAQFQSRGPTP